MPAGVPLTPEQRRRYLDLRRELGPVKAAEEMGIARSTGNHIWKDFLKGPADSPAAKLYDDMSREAKRAVNDFVYFAEEYLGLWTAPFWVQIATHLSEETTNPDPESFNLTLLTFHPGAGKTTILLAYMLWRVVRARALGDFGFAATFGSLTAAQTQRAGRQLRTWMRSDKSIRAFGRFKPEGSEDATWKGTQMVLAGMDPGKEATIALWSQGASISGVRPHLAIWDDLVDETNYDPINTDKLVEWWDGVAGKRVEPGGTICVSGVYWSPQDLYHELKEREFHNDDGTVVKKWRHFRFQAHNDELCPGDGTHPVYDPVSQTGCLLNPKRWSYRQLMGHKSDNEDLWQLQYQQNDLASINVLVPRIWWFGGRTTDGETFPGCVNKERSTWEWPAHYDLTVASLDPSPTAFIGAGIWDYSSRTGKHCVIDIERRRMSPAEYPGFIEAWTEAIRRDRPHFEHWIIERTGAVYLLGNEAIMAKFRQLGIQLIAHETNRNKADPRFGVQGLIQPEAKFGRLDIPYKTPEDRFRMLPLEREMLNYQTNLSMQRRQVGTTDCVMQTWFYLLHRPYLVASLTRAINRWAPGWVKTMARNPGASLWTPAGRGG